MLAIRSDSHVPECEQPGQKNVRLDALSHQTPIRKGLFRALQQIENFPARESTRGVVVRFVSGLLQVDKRRRDSNQFRLESLAVQARGELRGHIVIRKLSSHPLHVAMDERTRHAVSEGGPIVTGEHASCRVVDEQVKKTVARTALRRLACKGRFGSLTASCRACPSRSSCMLMTAM